MQYAKCTDDDRVWEAARFAELPSDVLEIKRNSLICAECEEFAWFRRESSHGHPAHFCAHHRDDCGLKIEYVVVDEPRNDTTIAEGQVDSGDTIVVRLDKEKGGQVDVTQVQSPPVRGQGEGGRTFILKGEGRESAQHFTLRKILLRLVQSPDFRNSERKIVFYKNEDEVLIRGPVREVVVSFADVTPTHHERMMFYWGPIASAGRTDDEKLWLNSSSRNKSVSISIFPDIVEDFLELFGVKNIDEFEGAHVLVAGKCYYTGTGKPVIWCGNHNYIFVRRYRDERLRAVL